MKQKIKKYKMRLIITLFFLSINLSGYAQHKKNNEIKTIEKLLEKKEIILNNYKLINSNDIEEYTEGFTETNSKDSLVMKELKITKDVSFITYKFTPTNYDKFHSDYFKLNGIKYTIDSLVKKSKIDLKYNNPYFYLRKKYIYINKKNKNKKLIIIQSTNRTFYNNKEVNSFFILQLNNKQTRLLLFYDLD